MRDFALHLQKHCPEKPMSKTADGADTAGGDEVEREQPGSGRRGRTAAALGHSGGTEEILVTKSIGSDGGGRKDNGRRGKI